MTLADSTYVIRASSPVRRILGAILRSNVIQPILRVARSPLGTGARFPDKCTGRVHGRVDHFRVARGPFSTRASSVLKRGYERSMS
jgi:hypothetical protein